MRNNIGKNIHTFFKNSFFRSTVIKWNNLDKNISSFESFALFKKIVLQFIQPTANRTFNYHNPIWIKLITRLRLGLSHLGDHKFKYNFLDCLNLVCCCDKDIETTVHYLLHCPVFSDERLIFFSNIRSIYENVLSGSDSRIFETLLFGISSFNNTKNTSILNTTIDYILSTKRFDVPLTNFWFVLKHLCIENIFKILQFNCQFVVQIQIFNCQFKFLPYYIIDLGI